MEALKRNIKEFNNLTSKEKHRIYLLCFLLLMALSLLSVVFFIYVELECKRANEWNENVILKRDYAEYTFHAYMKRFGKKYESDEYHQRLENFKVTLSEIDKLNKISEAHGSTAKFGFTEFSDLSGKQFRDMIGMGLNFSPLIGDMNQDCPPPIIDRTFPHDPIRLNRSELLSEEPLLLEVFEHEKTDLQPPIKFDWRKESYVAPVLNQGKCKSCWAHSVVGVMETMVAIKTKHRNRLSIQELLDCSKYNDQCSGGHPETAVEYLCNYQLPIIPEREYPLKNKNGTCKVKTKRPAHGVIVKHITSKENMTAKDIVDQIWRHGPVVAAINPYPLRHYIGGIIQYHCSGDADYSSHHVVQIVGYDMSLPTPHFIIRNSLGTDWGDEGYLYVAMKKGFICGIGRLIVYFDVEEI